MPWECLFSWQDNQHKTSRFPVLFHEEMTGSATPRHEIHLLSGFSVLLEGSQSPELPKAVQRLLAYVALYGPVQRPVLAGILWPKVDSDRAQMSLRQLLMHLRRLGLADLLTISRLEIKISPGVFVDATHWVREIERQEIVATKRALSALGSPLLPGWTEQWVISERNRLSELAALGSDTLPETRSDQELDIVPAFLKTANYLLATRPEAGWDLLSATLELWGHVPARVMRPTVERAFASIHRLHERWAEAAYQGARVFYLLGLHDKAIAYFTHIAVECSTHHPIHHAFGVGSAVVVLRETGRVKAALKEAEKLMYAMEKHRDSLASYSAHYLLESTQLLTNQSPDSLERCHRSLVLASNAGLGKLAQVFWQVNLALAYEAYDQPEPAESMLKEIKPVAYASGDRLALLSIRLLDAILTRPGEARLAELGSLMHASEGAGFTHFAVVCAEYRASAAWELVDEEGALESLAESKRLRNRSKTVPTPLERKKLAPLLNNQLRIGAVAH